MKALNICMIATLFLLGTVPFTCKAEANSNATPAQGCKAKIVKQSEVNPTPLCQSHPWDPHCKHY